MSRYKPSSATPPPPPPAPPQPPPGGGYPTYANSAARVAIMQAPAGRHKCPPGLEYLTLIDQLTIIQQLDSLEVLLEDYEKENTYQVFNSAAQRVYYAAEESDFFERYCCGSARAFEMNILDNMGYEVIRLYRARATGNCCCPCCLNNMKVEAPPGTLLGQIVQEWSMCIPKFVVLDENDDIVARIKGPPCTCCNAEFDVLRPDGVTSIGIIKKEWSGLLTEWLSNADNFGITFPMDLDPKIKAIMLGATFLIDFMYYEN